MSVVSFQGRSLKVSVVKCTDLKDNNWVSRPRYIGLKYANNEFRTRLCNDGRKNPVFEDHFFLSLIERLKELKITLFNKRTFRRSEVVGTARVSLERVLEEGHDDSIWPLQVQKDGQYMNVGVLHINLHFPDAKALYHLTSLYVPSPSPLVYSPSSLGASSVQAASISRNASPPPPLVYSPSLLGATSVQAASISPNASPPSPGFAPAITGK